MESGAGESVVAGQVREDGSGQLADGGHQEVGVELGDDVLVVPVVEAHRPAVRGVVEARLAHRDAEPDPFVQAVFVGVVPEVVQDLPLGAYRRLHRGFGE